MKKNIFCWLLFLSSFSLFAQKNDNVWLMGYQYVQGWPVPGLDFYFGSPDTIPYYTPFSFFETSASISDNNGVLQFYTNGIKMANKYHQILANSVDFNYDLGVDQFGLTEYFPYSQGAVIIPFPGHAGQYYVFHVCGQQLNVNGDFQPVKLSHSIVDMNLNAGAGEMILSNQAVINDTLLYGSLQAVKHANGRDWWIVIHAWKSRTFYKVLLTSNGISNISSQSIGPSIRKGFEGQSLFSPDGAHYAIAHSDSSQVYLFSFDRCSGDFIFETRLHSLFANACSFSPNSRYLYVSGFYSMHQYDLWSSNIDSSDINVGDYDGFLDPFPNYFNKHGLGPDGKIYINTLGSSRFVHVINQPDLPGLQCDFVQHQLMLFPYVTAMPVFPNYRLSNLPGSACDTLSLAAQQMNGNLPVFSISPNPNEGNFTVNYSVAQGKEATLEIYDAFGKKISFLQLLSDNTFKNVSIPGLPQGFYFCKINTGNRYNTIKWIKQ